ncbi:inhibitor of Bruton tyrosine kinase-like isoform X2 [Acipenser ruthenus]|uniref:inhibitor of Bruton tyrosine kinase-like isoform X2 n=1 Tax=Acipenser ruthenus TaxID=7906 RepID=UPI002740343A|nr:inhibitor of Bruton tyrosine kinase-like isoform X2 [Acipenser ruthenus]
MQTQNLHAEKPFYKRPRRSQGAALTVRGVITSLTSSTARPPQQTPSSTSFLCTDLELGATPLHGSPSPKSFLDLLMEEEETVRPVLSSGSVIKKVSFKDTEQHENEKKLPGWPAKSTHSIGDHIPTSAQADGYNPWLKPAVNSPPAVAPVTFAAIVEEEQQQEAALLRSREKPLALIQIEECATQDLLIHYNAFDNPDEFITVEKASQGPIAIPMWNKH